MQKKQKELLSLGKTKRSRGFTLVELAIGGAILAVIGSFVVPEVISFGKKSVTPVQSINLVNVINNIKNQTWAVFAETKRCFPKGLSYIMTGIPTAENNTCGTDAPTIPPYLKIAPSSSSSDNNTIYFYDNSITMSFVVVGSDSEMLMLKVNGDKNIIDNLKGRICEGGETTNPEDVVSNSDLSHCHYDSGKLYYLIGGIPQ